MKTNLVYFYFAFLSCVLGYFNFLNLSIVVKWIAFVVITIFYFIHVSRNNILFYLSLIIAGIGETLLVYGMENNDLEVTICFTLYSWLLIPLIKNSATNVSYKFKREHLVTSIISTALVVFLIYYVLVLILPKILDIIFYSYFFVFSFAILLGYLAVLFISKHNKRYMWLLFLLIAFVASLVLASLETYYLSNLIVEQLVYLIQFASHFFLVKFLITEDEETKFI